MDDPTRFKAILTRPKIPRSNCLVPVLLSLLLGVATALLDFHSASAQVPTQQMNTITEVKKGATPVPFYDALLKALKKRKLKIDDLCPHSDPVARRILEEYGAIYVASKKVLPPPLCVFTNEAQVTKFQNDAGIASEVFGYDEIELQPAALKALLKACEDAEKEALTITPRDGAEAARRNYEDSVRLWKSRFEPALDYWLSQGRLTQVHVERLKGLPLNQQVAEVLELEKGGIYFSKDLSKSILYSIAAPGASQHIAMLAFDVNEFQNPRIREILANRGWFQTVISDLPHFTYLGLKEKDLPKAGLRSVEVNGQVFWIPNVAGSQHPGLKEPD